jgi:hypothetical protein
MLWKDFTTDEINKKIQRENVIHLAIQLLHPFRRSNIVWLSMIFQSRQRPKKVIERLKDTLWSLPAPGNKSGEHFFYLEFEKLEVKIYQGAKRCSWLIN